MSLYRVQLKVHARSSPGATAAQHAAYILRDVITPETQAYVQYVLRQSRKSQDREDLAHAEWHNMPAWTMDKPVEFFLAAEEYERVRGRISMTLEVALPQELSREAQIALMQDYCTSQFPQQPYVVGLHDSVGASGAPNPHFHVTWSERIHDGQDRGAEDFFRQPPRGAGKDRVFNANGWLTATRQAWSDLANVYVERAGIEGAYVDPRSLTHRGIEREPEPRLDPGHSTKAKLGRGITPEWQAVLDGRKQREAFRAMEQAIAADAWKVRKEELGITDVHSLDRERFVQQVAQQTREQALTPRRTLQEIRAEEAQLQQDILSLETTLRTTEQALATEARLAHRAHQRQQGRTGPQQTAEHTPRVRRGYDPSGRIFDRGQGRGRG